MEEKERKQLKKRLLGLVINEPPYPYPITMAEVMVNDMSKPNLKPLLNFIEQELDRAREETRQEERDMFIVRYATVSFNEVIKTIKTLSIIEFLSIKWGLKGKKKSKLTTK